MGRLALARLALLACSFLRGCETVRGQDCSSSVIADVGNGMCDAENNTPSCEYDGGDCCACTCEDGPLYACGEDAFDCLDPACDVMSGASASDLYPFCTGDVSTIGDGGCNTANNDPSCGYDGGDCCACTCVDGPVFVCSSLDFACDDPACLDAIIENSPDCTGDLSTVSDGQCDAKNNNEPCNFDGGDCCMCTCIDGGTCSFYEFECLDPDGGSEIHNCDSPPPAVIPCPAEAQQSWVVENSDDARALAVAMNCSGGTFEVEWDGSITLDSTMYIVEGNVVNVTGIGSNATVDGYAGTRPFTVVNASLHLRGIVVMNGIGVVGGAIAAIGSNLTFERTAFTANVASGSGGAIYLSGGSILLCLGDTYLLGNSAGGDGGALYVSDGSVVHFSGAVYFSNNTAGDDGGAFMVNDASRVVWSGDTAVFLNNRADVAGGAAYVFGGSTISWSARTSFESNSALNGGALMVRGGSQISWDAEASFDGNSAVFSGGALLIMDNSAAVWSGKAAFVSNRCLSVGGAVSATTNSSVMWSGEAQFFNNTAKEAGGAVISSEHSIISWNGEATFSNNTAAYGGALCATSVATYSWNGRTTFASNSATNGGALYAAYSAIFFWKGDVTFSNNTAADGGVLYATEDSLVTFSGDTVFEDNSAIYNTAYSTGAGGALLIVRSAIAWNGYVCFKHNTATYMAGAVLVSASSISWAGETVFAGNVAGDFGGAMVVEENSVAAWSGTTNLTGNVARIRGGAFYVKGSHLSWNDEVTFDGNIALHGGAISAVLGTGVSWSGETMFAHNRAAADDDPRTGAGGALLVEGGSTASWSGRTRFINDSSTLYGGALQVSNSSSVYWTGTTTFSENTAHEGGAIYIYNGSSVGWNGTTDFASNHAVGAGGAVGSLPYDRIFNAEESTLLIDGTTTFVNNTSDGNGGGVAMLGALSMYFGTTDVGFYRNSAELAGGAVFASGTGVGPQFFNLTFTSNSAQAGGAVYATGSGGDKRTVFGEQLPNPTTFNASRFVGNRALATGGAVQSAAGEDVFVDTMFENNTAQVGGALRLAGNAELTNCSFIENASNLNEGPTISNIGFIPALSGSSFVRNTFNCQPRTFLDFKVTGDMYESICSGCPVTCENCHFEESAAVPICANVLDHSTSGGGAVTLEEITIERGYWRATNSSRNVLACYNADACHGGITGTPGYCLRGYEGPYCSICSDGYAAGLGFSCSRCSQHAGGIVLAVVLAIAAFVAAAAVVAHLISDVIEDAGRGCVGRMAKYVPLQTLKIVIVAWQILTQFSSVANVVYPDTYHRFLDSVDVLNFDLSWVISAGCFVNVDFHARLLISTIGPILVTMTLGVTYVVASRKFRSSERTTRNVKYKHVSSVLLLTFLVYSNVSSILFQMFACENLDDGNNYLRADYRIECDSSKHRALQVYAGLMIVVYPLGIPAFYAFLLYRDRSVLMKSESKRGADSERVRPTSDLWTPYKPSMFFYEVIECMRRILLAGVVVFIYPNTAAQLAVTLMLAFSFAMIAEGLAPYASRWDTWISRTGHVVVVVSIYVALLLKVDVSDERSESQKVFEAVLVTVHACMVLAIVAETCVLACASRDVADSSRELQDPTPRFRNGRKLPSRRQVSKSRNDPSHVEDIREEKV